MEAIIMSTPEQNERRYTGAEFLGRWIGETQGCDSPGHHWEISHAARWLRIDTTWECEQASNYYPADVIAERPELKIDRFTAVLISPQHFVIVGWDTNDTRNHEGPDYDVIFSRPGIAELDAARVYERWRTDEGVKG